MYDIVLSTTICIYLLKSGSEESRKEETRCRKEKTGERNEGLKEKL